MTTTQPPRGHGRDRAPRGARIIARVTSVLVARKFAFLKTPDGTEYFMHQAWSTIPLDELREGQLLSIVRVDSAKGPRATNVRRLTDAEEDEYAASYGNR